MQQIGLFFGTFNPIHNGHLILANHFAEHTNLDQIWFVITPQNPFKQKLSMLANNHRLELVYRATREYPTLQPCTIEFNFPRPNYTSDTLIRLEEKYPDKKFALLIGEDNLSSFHKWKNFEVILDRYPLYVYPRNGAAAPAKELEKYNNIHLVDAPKVEVASSQIREWIKLGKNVRPLLPLESWEYLDEMNFYKK
ncbi:MAG: nicotinate (nicotinamide) nucleotide adenylyltransferase [Flavobacteriaceae bacterium]|jgi:nicotinate-nucleotide adenylyltransferase